MMLHPKSLAKPSHTEELNKQLYLASALPSSQDLGEAIKSNTPPLNTTDQRKLQELPEQKATTNAVLPAAPSQLSQAETPAVVADGRKLVFHPAHLQPCRILWEVRHILAAFRNSRGKE